MSDDDVAERAATLLRTLAVVPMLTPHDRAAAAELVAQGLASRVNDLGTIEVTKAGRRRTVRRRRTEPDARELPRYDRRSGGR